MNDHFKGLLAERRRAARTAVRNFVSGAASGDVRLMSASVEALSYAEDYGGGWKRALRAVCRLNKLPSETREAFLQMFLELGTRLRLDTDDDLVLSDGLRKLLPPYSGPAVKLFRGEGAMNRRHRRYGLSWSSDRSVALAYAETGNWRCSTGGSVLLATLAPRASIICAPALIYDRYGEREFVVDRRRLKHISVEARFSQLNLKELDRLCEERRKQLAD